MLNLIKSKVLYKHHIDLNIIHKDIIHIDLNKINFFLLFV